jgi:hypothetical protein
MNRFFSGPPAADVKRYFANFTLVVVALAAIGGVGAAGFGLFQGDILARAGSAGAANAMLQPAQTNTPLVTLTPTVTATRPTSTATQTPGSPTATDTATPPAGTTGTATQTRTRTATAITTATATATATGTGTAQPTATAFGTATQTPLPTITPIAAKVTICHRTGSARNPYRRITVSVNALPAHQGHGDIVPAPPAGCPAAQAPTTKVKPNKANGNQNQGAASPNNQNNSNAPDNKGKGNDQGKSNGNDKPGKRP